MKKIYFAFLFLFSLALANNAQVWSVYDGSVLPVNTDDGIQLDIHNINDDTPGVGFHVEVIDDPNNPGNKILDYRNPDGRTTYRYNFPAEFTGTGYTLIARLKGNGDGVTYDRVFDIRWDNGNQGTRDEIRIWYDGRVEIEKANVTGDPGSTWDPNEWHTYRIVVSGDVSTIYIDESPNAFISGTTTATTTNKYMKFGDGSGEHIGGYIDWIAVDMTGAYAPGEGAAIPDTLLMATPSNNASLASLTPDVGTLVPDFDPDVTIYDLEIPGTSSGVTLTAVADYFASSISGDGLISAPGTVTITVTAQDGSTKDYVVNITVAVVLSDDATLSDISVSAGTLTPAFDAGVFAYTLEVPFGTTSVAVSASPANGGATVAGTGDITVPGTATILVTAEDGETSLTYEITITEAEPLAQGWNVYDASVLPVNTNDGIQLEIHNVNDNSPGAGFQVQIINDPDNAGNKILDYRNPDGKTTYRYSFPDEFNGNEYTLMARLKGNGESETFDRVFDMRWDNAIQGTRDEIRIWYDQRVEIEKADVTAIPGTSWDPNEWHLYRITVVGDVSTVYLDESPVALISGTTTSTTTNKYMKFGDGSGEHVGGYVDWIAVDLSGAYAPGEGAAIPDSLLLVPGSGDANLVSLTPDPGTLVPDFDPAVVSYDLEIPNSSSEVTLTAVADYFAATVGGDGLISAPGTATITVTAQDGATKDYVVNITVAATLSDDATLASLTPGAGTLDPAFSSDITTYDLELPGGSISVTFTAETTHANATVSGDGEFSNVPGTATLTVTAEDGTTTKDYTVNVTVSTVGVEGYKDNGFGIYPNPASGVFTLKGAPGVRITVLNAVGSMVSEFTMTEDSRTISTEKYKQGIYFVRMDSKDHVTVKKLIIK